MAHRFSLTILVSFYLQSCKRLWKIRKWKNKNKNVSTSVFLLWDVPVTLKKTWRMGWKSITSPSPSSLSLSLSHTQTDRQTDRQTDTHTHTHRHTHTHTHRHTHTLNFLGSFFILKNFKHTLKNYLCDSYPQMSLFVRWNNNLKNTHFSVTW